MTLLETLEAALDSLGELVADPQCDFGPAYEGMKQRQQQAKTAIRQQIRALKEMKK